MKALCWHGPHRLTIDSVPEPTLIDPEDIILKVTSTAICGSDLHMYNGFLSDMKKGNILGHEFMGEVVEVGHGVTQLKVGDRVVVPAIIACGKCDYCRR